LIEHFESLHLSLTKDYYRYMGMQQAHPNNFPVNDSDQRRRQETAEFRNQRTARVRQRPDIPVLGSPFFQISIAGLSAAFLLVTIGVAALGRDLYPDGTVPAGVIVAGAEIGELSEDEAREQVRERIADFAERPFVLIYGDRMWEPSMADLGADFELQQTIRQASASHSPIQRAQMRVFGVDQRELPLRMSLKDEMLREYVKSLAMEINASPQAPALGMHDGRLTVSEAKIGIEVQEDALADSIKDALFSLSREPISVPYEEIAPEFDDADVESVKALIDDALSEPLTIWFEDLAWNIEPEQLAEFLSLQPADNGEMQLAFYHDPLIGFLDRLIGDVNRPARNAEIAWGGSGVVATSPSQNGIERDLYALVPRLEEAIANGERSIELTYNVTRPAIDSNNLHELGIDGLMAQGESAFWNSAPSRAHNIAVAAGYLDGTLIPPGHEFSFNRAIGEISKERGYQEGYVIEAEATVEGIGGGVCQVSTTVFRAAFFSGLPITERHPHAYVVGYYEQDRWPLGFDAAIFQPDLDFRFVNSTDSYMLVHTHVADQQLYVNLYGPDLGYSVELGEPTIQNRAAPPSDVEVVDESLAPGERRQVEQAKEGMEVTLPRTVTNRAGEVVRQDYFYSNFQAWGNRYLVGPSTSPSAQDPSDAPGAGTPSGEIIEETSSDSPEG
jgi:vancomycin resistance protein YoaR